MTKFVQMKTLNLEGQKGKWHISCVIPTWCIPLTLLTLDSYLTLINSPSSSADLTWAEFLSSNSDFRSRCLKFFWEILSKSFLIDFFHNFFLFIDFLFLLWCVFKPFTWVASLWWFWNGEILKIWIGVDYLLWYSGGKFLTCTKIIIIYQLWHKQNN